jgi:hypothetical protein
MRIYFALFIFAISAQTAACAEASVLSEPIFFPFNIFSAPQRASFELEVAKRGKYNAIINLKTSQSNSGSLMDFARHITDTRGYLKLPLQAHIKMTRIDSKEVVLDYTTNTEELYASSRTQLTFRIQEIILEKGKFDVVVETLAASEPIEGVTSSFGLFVRKL